MSAPDIASSIEDGAGGILGDVGYDGIEIGAQTVAQLDIGPHVEAWGELLCTAVGLPPVPDGVAVIPSRRGQRGSGVTP